MREKEISLAKFLTRYQMICGKDLTKIRHEDVKVIFPNLKRCSFEKIQKDPSLVYTGKVLLVNDGKRTIPYYAPKLDILDNELSEIKINKEDYKPIKKLYDYTSMSNYDLKCLLKNKFDSYKNKRKAKKELQSRGFLLKRKFKVEKGFNIEEE